jgi:hypothetical protein
MWCRIFAACDEPPDLDALRRELGVTVESGGEGPQWFWADVSKNSARVRLERYTTDEQGLRAELNAWAATAEATDDTPATAGLMEKIIQARQLITVEGEDGDELAGAVARWLARRTQSVWQMDGQGFFGPDGELLLREG